MKILLVSGLLLFILVLFKVDVFSQQDSGRKKRTNSNNIDDGAPKVGEIAPLFKIKSLDGKNEFDLENFRNNKPVILFFGSYT